MREVALKTTLYCRQPPSHDKVYHIQLKQVAGGWLCTSQYGKRGYGLTEANPMEVPAGYAVARAVFMKLYDQKSRKYTEDARGDRLRGSAPIIEEEVGPAPRADVTADAREVVKGLQRAKEKAQRASLAQEAAADLQRANQPAEPPPKPELRGVASHRRKIDLTLLEDE